MLKHGRNLGALLLAALLAAISVQLIAAPAALSAEPSTNVYPGQTVSITVKSSRIPKDNTFWLLTAPRNTSVLEAHGNPGTGGAEFNCRVTGSGANCGPAPAGIQNFVVLRLLVSANAPAGIVTGSAYLAGETLTFGINVLSPPSPLITSPENGAKIGTPDIPITGEKQAGNSVVVLIDNQIACKVPADGLNSWSCITSLSLSPGDHVITAYQNSPGGNKSSESVPRTISMLGASLSIKTEIPTQASVGKPFAVNLTIANKGQAAAVAATTAINVGKIALSQCSLDARPVECADLVNGRFPLGAIAAKSQVSLKMLAQAAAQTPAGSSAEIIAQIDSPSIASPIISRSRVVFVGLTAPVISAPAQGGLISDSSPLLAGKAEPGNFVKLDLDGSPACAADPRADDSGSWTCRVNRTLSVGVHTLQATQANAEGPSSDAAVSTFSVRPEAPTILVPSADEIVQDLAPTFSGTKGSPSSKIVVAAESRPICTGTSNASGQWSCTATEKLPLGSISVTAIQTLDGISSEPSQARTFTISLRSSSVLTPPAPRPKSELPVQNPTPPDQSPPTQQQSAVNTISLRFESSPMLSEGVSMFDGVIGPNPLAKEVELKLSGVVSRGAVYRSAFTELGGRCSVSANTLSCSLKLNPGQSSHIRFWLFVDKQNSSDVVRQTFTISSNDPQVHGMSVISSTLGDLSDAMSRRNRFEIGPNTYLSLVSVLLLGLAATEVEKRRKRKFLRPEMETP